MTQKPEKDPNDKYSKYDFGIRCNEHHDEDEFNPETDAKLDDWHNRHRDKLLDDFCDTHPGAPQCKVFDE